MEVKVLIYLYVYLIVSKLLFVVWGFMEQTASRVFIKMTITCTILIKHYRCIILKKKKDKRKTRWFSNQAWLRSKFREERSTFKLQTGIMVTKDNFLCQYKGLTLALIERTHNMKKLFHLTFKTKWWQYGLYIIWAP